MFGLVLPGAMILLSIGQTDGNRTYTPRQQPGGRLPAAAGTDAVTSPVAHRAGGDRSGPVGRAVDALVVAENLHVHDGADDSSYLSATLVRGEHVRVRQLVAAEWLAIDPPPAAICWIERSALALNESANHAEAHADYPAESHSGVPRRARVSVSRAVIRSGNPRARRPGPPISAVDEGTIIVLVDQAPVVIGQGAGATTWYAMAPSAGQLRYVRAAGTNWSPALAARKGEAEARVAYRPGGNDGHTAARIATGTPTSTQESAKLPAHVAAEIEAVEAMHRSILVNQPIEAWRFDNVRARYQTLLKQAGASVAVEDAIRSRLVQVTRHEQASQAAQTISSILIKSRRRDEAVAAIENRLAATESSGARSYSAVGFVQPSSSMLDGHKVFALIGPSGSTVAYLDIPPGLEVHSHFSHRVGVRGVMHYNEELGARLITVKDLEAIGTTKR